MPVVRAREVKVTDEDVSNVRPQEIVTRRPNPVQERHTSLADRALLRLYVSVSPFFFFLFIVVPIVLWIGTVFVRQYSWPIVYVFGASFAGEIKKSCPPDCTWHNLLMWAILGGAGLVLSILLSGVLRRRLLKAIG